MVDECAESPIPKKKKDSYFSSQESVGKGYNVLPKLTIEGEKALGELRISSPAGVPHLFLENFFGHNIVYFDQRLYAVKHGMSFGAQTLDAHASSDYVSDLLFYVLEQMRKKLNPLDTILIDTAYGFYVYIAQNSYVATRIAFPEGTGMTGMPESQETWRAIHLGELYARLESIRNNEMEIVLHIGFPKTGSKFLQTNVFPHLAGYHYVDWETDFFSREILKLKYGNPACSVESIRQAFIEYMSVRSESKVIISDESFTDIWDRGKGWLEKAIVLKAIFPQAKIICVIREQTALLGSLYLEHLRAGGFVSCERFLRAEGGVLKFDYIDYSGYSQVMVESLDYRVVSDIYVDLFGEQNVKFFAFELLRKNPHDYVEKICAFLNVAAPATLRMSVENRAYGVVGMHLARVINRFIIHEHGNLGCIVERPFFQKLDTLVHQLDRRLPIREVSKWKCLRNTFLRKIAIRSWKLSACFTVNNAITALDKLFYRKVDPIPEMLKSQLVSFYAERNEMLNKKHNLNLQQLGYY